MLTSFLHSHPGNSSPASAVSTIGPLPVYSAKTPKTPTKSSKTKHAYELESAKPSAKIVPQLDAPFELVTSSPSPSYTQTQSRRASKRIEQWLQQTRKTQTTFADDLEEAERKAKAAGTPVNPYLAYPNFARVSGVVDEVTQRSRSSEVAIVESENLSVRPREELRATHGPQGSVSLNNLQVRACFLANVIECDAQSAAFAASRFIFAQTPTNDLLPPSAPFASSNRSFRAPRPSSILSITSFKKLPFARTLPTQRSVSSPHQVGTPSTPTSTFKTPIIRRRSPIPENFLNTDPAATMNMEAVTRPRKNSTLSMPKTPESQRSSTMRKRLGNLLRGYAGDPNMSHASPSSSKHSSSPRPSTSNSSATASTSTAVDNELRSSTSASPRTNRSTRKFNINLSDAAAFSPLEGSSSPARSSFSHEHEDHYACSSPTVFPHHTHTSHPFAAEHIPSTPGLSKRASQPIIFGNKKHNVSSSALSTLSIGSIGSLATNAGSMFNGASAARQKRLVVNGIPWDDAAAIQGLKRWCEVRICSLVHLVSVLYSLRLRRVSV